MIMVIQRSLHVRDVPQLTFVIFTWTEQITEELNFVQKLDVVSLNYKLTHNIDTLKTLQIKDRIELQVGYEPGAMARGGHLGKWDGRGQQVQMGLYRFAVLVKGSPGAPFALEGSPEAQFVLMEKSLGQDFPQAWGWRLLPVWSERKVLHLWVWQSCSVPWTHRAEGSIAGVSLGPFQMVFTFWNCNYHCHYLA